MRSSAGVIGLLIAYLWLTLLMLGVWKPTVLRFRISLRFIAGLSVICSKSKNF